MQNSGAPAKVRSLTLDDGRAFIKSLLERKTRYANHCLRPEVPGGLAPQAIDGYVRALRAARRQDLGQRMEKGIRHILGAWAELQRRQEFGHRVKRHPQVIGCVAQSGPTAIHPVAHARGSGSGTNEPEPGGRADRRARASGAASPLSDGRAERHPRYSSPSG